MSPNMLSRTLAIKERLRSFRRHFDAIRQHLHIAVVAFVLPGKIGVARDLLQHAVQLGRSRGDPLQVFVVEHMAMAGSAFVRVVCACPPHTTQHGANRNGK